MHDLILQLGLNIYNEQQYLDIQVDENKIKCGLKPGRTNAPTKAMHIYKQDNNIIVEFVKPNPKTRPKYNPATGLFEGAKFQKIVVKQYTYETVEEAKDGIKEILGV